MDKRIEYIGRRPNFTDHLYGTGLTFVTGQVRVLPAVLAAKFLRHIDLFSEAAQKQQDEQVQLADPAVTNAQQGHIDKPEDDTAAVLQAAQKQQDEQARKDLERGQLLDQIRVMTQPELLTLARDRWNQVLRKNMSLENARERVIQFVDQYGVA